jgi:hypothetical protein
MIEKNELEQARNVCKDSLQLEAWKQHVGTQLTLAHAYCDLFVSDGKIKDTIAVRKSLEVLNEDQIESCEDFFKNLAF